MLLKLSITLVVTLLVVQASDEVIPSLLLSFNNDDFTYTSVYIGEPRQEFNWFFDTGSPTTWVMSKKYKGDCAHSFNGYDSTKSTTYKEIGTKFTSDHFEGFLSEDTFDFTVLYEVKNQVFAEVTNYPGTTMCWRKFAGSFGIGLNNGSHPKTLIENMVEQDVISHATVAFNLIKRKGIEAGSDGGSVIIGKNESVKKLNYVPTTSPSKWTVDLAGISVGNDLKVCANGCSAKVESGQYWNYGPVDEIRKINEAIGAEESVWEGHSVWTINCDPIGKPDVVYTIGGRDYVLEPKHYIVDRRSSSHIGCSSAFAAWRNPQEIGWSLGLNFIERFYIVLDYENKAIGFGEKSP